MTNLSILDDLADAIENSGPAPKFRRRMGTVSAINTNYTINVTVAGSTTVLSNVKYFAHYAPKVGSQVWLDTDGRDWIAVGAIAGSGGQVPSCKVFRTADLSVATGSAYTTVPWQTTDFDPWGMWSSGAATNVVAPISGRYLVTAQIEWTGNATSYRGASLRVNGSNTSNFAFVQNDSSGTALFSHSISSVRAAQAGDYFQLLVRQNSGAALAMSGTTVAESHMTVTYLGPDA